MSRILIAGCGDIGTRLGCRLANEGHTVWGLRRNPEAIPPPIIALRADLSCPETLHVIPEQLDWIYIILTADGFDDDSYKTTYVDGTRNLLDFLGNRKSTSPRILFISSTGVYQQSQGELVDEDSPTSPVSFSGRRLLEAEQLVAESWIPSTCIRFAGIYGPGRTRFIERVRNLRVWFSTEYPTYRNLIHIEDVIGILTHLVTHSALEPIYVGTDNEPVDTYKLVCWIAEKLGMPADEIKSANLDEGARRGTNKRCSNKKISGTGYRFRYPSYREGYSEILDAMNH